MWYYIALTWLALSYPLARNIDKEMAQGDNLLRFNIIENILIFVKTLITMPIYYVILIGNTLSNRK